MRQLTTASLFALATLAAACSGDPSSAPPSDSTGAPGATDNSASGDSIDTRKHPGPAPDAGTGGVGTGTGTGTGGGTGGGAGADAGTGGTGTAPGACTAVGGGGGPGGGPADMFPCDSPWYKDVSALPAYTTEDIPGTIGTWGSGNQFRVDFSIVYLHANASTAKHTFALDSSYDPDNDHDPVPVPATGSVEGESGYACTQGGDCHLIVVDDSTHKLFELWQATNASGPWAATQETVWDLTKHYGPDSRGQGCTSADAAGLPILPGLIGVKEVAAGEVKHALRFILPGAKIRKNGYMAPAVHSTGVYSGGAHSPPMGMRMRLKAGFNVAALPSAGAKVVARALKKYGMLLADAGQDALTAESDQFETTKWAGLLGGGDLASIKVSDFEVVDYGTVHTPASMDCIRVF